MYDREYSLSLLPVVPICPTMYPGMKKLDFLKKMGFRFYRFLKKFLAFLNFSVKKNGHKF